MEATGIIFNVGHYAIHDGPGIRTTVFLKGCPSRCLWCCSPESQSFETEDCTARGGKVYGRRVTASEIFSEIRRDAPFWRRSGGGVTISGGEVMSQPDFACELLLLCRKHFVHTAVESCLFAPLEIVQRIAAFTDYIQFDIKAMCSDLHRRLTSLDNDHILQNAAWLLGNHDNLLVRFPLVPGINDFAEEIEALGRFVSSHRQGARLEILKYHRMGVGTYEALGREYPLPDVQPPTSAQVEAAAAILRRYQIDVIHA